VYVCSDSRTVYQQYIEKNLPDILKDPKVSEDKKATLLYDTSQTLVKDVLANPLYSDNIRRSQDMVENTVGYILKGRRAFLNLMKITSFDYYTYTHSVNVCTFSVAMARQIGITDTTALSELGTGALLHDVGKSKVPERILNKHTGLNRSEFEIIKKHPLWGMEILKETNLIPDESYHPVLGHHERVDGSGYPRGQILKDQHIFSRIVAVCDVFDALTTQRVYQKAINTFPALKLMHSMSDTLDANLLRELTILMGPSSTHNNY
jgi:putative nucleotidyltransferase with HDIG domain